MWPKCLSNLHELWSLNNFSGPDLPPLWGIIPLPCFAKNQWAVHSAHLCYKFQPDTASVNYNTNINWLDLCQSFSIVLSFDHRTSSPFESSAQDLNLNSKWLGGSWIDWNREMGLNWWPDARRTASKLKQLFQLSNEKNVYLDNFVFITVSKISFLKKPREELEETFLHQSIEFEMYIDQSDHTCVCVLIEINIHGATCHIKHSKFLLLVPGLDKQNWQQSNLIFC